MSDEDPQIVIAFDPASQNADYAAMVVCEISNATGIINVLDYRRKATAMEVAVKLAEHGRKTRLLFEAWDAWREIRGLMCAWPVRMHKQRRWMTDQYHRRIQKKWNKRFGV